MFGFISWLLLSPKTLISSAPRSIADNTLGCFDSNPEYQLFGKMLEDDKIKKVWFTGMLTHGQSDFVINYIDPNSHTVRSYYPDFLVQQEDGSYLIIEVKGDNMIDDEVVLAKADYAKQMATASNMTYKMVKGSDAMNGNAVY